MPNTVLVHKCFDGEVFGPVGLTLAGRPSEPIFTPIPDRHSCKCKKRIKTHERDEMLALGAAFVVLRETETGHRAPEWREIVLRRKQAKAPRGATIEKAHIERAFLLSQEHERSKDERERIEVYNEVNQKGLAALGASLRERRALSPSARVEPNEVPGLPVLTFFDDMRTNAGMIRQANHD